MNKGTTIQIGIALALLGCAGVLGYRYWQSHNAGADGLVYFYDQSQQKLFAAPRDSVPPIAGLDSKEIDAVRAIVIAPNGNPREKKQVKIAYLETYTPEMKAQLEELRRVEAAGKSTVGLVGRGALPRNTLVRRTTDTQWQPMTSPEGEKIVAEWNLPGPDGKYPAICVP